MKIHTFIIPLFLITTPATAQQYGHWESINTNSGIYTHFVNQNFAETYKSRGFAGIHLRSPQSQSSQNNIYKNNYLPTIPYYQRQIDTVGEPRGAGKWLNYGETGTFGFKKPL